MHRVASPHSWYARPTGYRKQYRLNLRKSENHERSAELVLMLCLAYDWGPIFAIVRKHSEYLDMINE